MKWLLFVSAMLWALVLWSSGADTAFRYHAAVMGMVTLIGALILDKLDKNGTNDDRSR
jgi:hypothetical protein